MNGYWGKATTFARTARLLLEAGDTDGAVNRGYYAMLIAAKAALEAVDPALAVAKTHATIIRRFGKHIVVERGLDRSLGRLLNQAEHLRLLSDYGSEPIGLIEARELVSEMERFLTTVGPLLGKSTP